jgi:hypothetical protein
MDLVQMPAREDVFQVVKEYDSDPCCLELIQFFGWYPNARFSRLAVLHALSANSERRCIEKALKELIDKGMVKTYSENNTPFYCLSDDASKREAALELARLDWRQWHGVLRQSYAHLWSYVTKQGPSSFSAVTNA